MTRSTQVAIVGAGPSGLLLSQLLRRNGIDSVVLERPLAGSRASPHPRGAAGVDHRGNCFRRPGVGARMMRDGLVHDGFDIAFANGRHRIDLKGLTGRSVSGLRARPNCRRTSCRPERAKPGAVLWQVVEVVLQDWDTHQPRVTYTHAGTPHELRCDFIAGCDGYHGVSRAGVPPEKTLAVRARVPVRMARACWPMCRRCTRSSCTPITSGGFALCSMRSRGRSRYYVQCSLEDKVEQWPDGRFLG